MSGFSSVSTHTQHALAVVLEDKIFLDQYFVDSQRLLAQWSHYICDELRTLRIPFVQPTSGIFIWIDLRAWMDAQTFDAEQRLFQEMFGKCKLILTPGRSCGSVSPGFFRFCFAAASMAALEETFKRLHKLKTEKSVTNELKA
jgi:1-aminocyclopropane-1-carboxylate synthase